MRLFIPRDGRRRSLAAAVVAALQPRSRRDDRHVPCGNESRPEDEMLAYLTAEGRFLGFDRGDWALLIAALAAVVLLTTLST